MTKFKFKFPVGARVHVSKGALAGQVATVEEHREDSSFYPYGLRGDDGRTDIEEEGSLRLARDPLCVIKAGDRVRVLKDAANLANVRAGDVFVVDRISSGSIVVCSGKDDAPRWWYFSFDNVELVVEPASSSEVEIEVETKKTFRVGTSTLVVTSGGPIYVSLASDVGFRIKAESAPVLLALLKACVASEA